MRPGEGLQGLVIRRQANIFKDLGDNISRDKRYLFDAPFFRYVVGGSAGGAAAYFIIVALGAAALTPAAPLVIPTIGALVVAGGTCGAGYDAQIKWQRETYLFAVKEVLGLLLSNLRENDFYVCKAQFKDRLARVQNFVVHGIQFYIDGSYKVYATFESLEVLATTIRNLVNLPLFCTQDAVPDRGNLFYAQTSLNFVMKACALRRDLSERGMLAPQVTTSPKVAEGVARLLAPQQEGKAHRE
jgi:hypothetical protein